MKDYSHKDSFFWNGFNNIGIGSIALASVLNNCQTLTVSKALLVLPMIIHSPTLSYMASKSTRMRSSAALTSSHPHLFSNFNERFESTLPLTLNSIQFLVHLKIAEFTDTLKIKKEIKFENDFGKRAEKIFKASCKISSLLSENDDELYLNLRVKL